MSARVLSACLALPVLAGCSHAFFWAAPEPLQRAPVQDAQSILLTLNEKPRVKPKTLAELGISVKPAAPQWLARADAQPKEAEAPSPAARVALVAPVAPAAPVAPVAQAAPVQPAPPVAEMVLETLEAWRTAWEQGDAARYIGFYDSAYTGGARSRAEWERQRTQRLANGRIRLAMYQVKVQPRSEGEAEVRFVQAYTSGRHSDHGEKHMKLRRESDGWKIVQETWTASLAQ